MTDLDANADDSGQLQPQDGPDEEFGTRVLESMREIFWDPEIARRGGLDVTGQVHRALAILRPGQPVEVQLNDEFQLVARAKLNSAVQKGDPIALDNVDAIEALEPVGVDLNAGWVVWAVLPDGSQMAAFDFIRNRGHSLRLLELAGDYIATAQDALGAGRIGPALENAMAAAELAITAQTYSLHADEPTAGGRRNAHSARMHWSKVHVGLGNTTGDAHDTLVSLNKLRPASRYGEGKLAALQQATSLVQSVNRLVEDAGRRVGPPLRTQDPDFVASMEG